jgi:hypothetical protein
MHGSARTEPAPARDFPVRQPVVASLLAVVLVWCTARFVALADVPHGYWLDETLGAVHVRCIAETGGSAGTRWPLFPYAHGGGVFGPTYIYLALAWTRLFGDSVACLRAIAALANLATILGLVLIAHRLGGRRFALTTAVAAALSPWSFQFSRIAWDPPLGPALLVVGSVLLVRGRRPITCALAGVAMALAAYSYTPTRLQVAVWLPVLLAILWRRGRIDDRGAAAAMAAFAVTIAPLAFLMLTGRINARIQELSILSEPWREWSRELRGHTPEALFLFFAFLDNVHAHLRPGFLFLWGDANLRHSTQASGVLGAVDGLALTMAAGLAGRRLLRPSAHPGGSITADDARLALLLGLGVLAGITPAALCWEGVPHALRAIGAWPFLSLLSGLILARAWSSWPPLGPLLLAVSVAFTALFLPYYFGPYRRIDPRWFHPDLQAAVESEPARPASLTLEPFVYRPGYERPELQFYLMDHDRLGCEEAARVARAMWPDGR